jgi:hypothetical protein
MNKGPHSRSNCITKDSRLIIGSEPYFTKETFKSLLDYGVTMVVDLRKHSHICYKNPSMKIVKFPISNGSIPKTKNISKLIEIVIQEYNNNGVVYVHCHGGHGRAGLVGALLLGHLYNLTGPEAIKRIEEYRETRTDTSRNFIPTPETQKQVNFVCNILGIGSDEQIPDRSDESWLYRVLKERKQN